MYLIRESKISLDNDFYKPGGYYNTLSASNSLQLPNCTLYALLRSWESLGKKVTGIARDTYGFPDAKEWLNTTKMPVLNNPKPGCIAVFGGSGNHVAFVEDVLDNGDCLITQSSYDTNKNNRGTNFWNKTTKTLRKNSVISGYGTVLGFIDVGVNDIRKTYGNLHVKDRMHRVRRGPGLSYPDVLEGCYAATGFYNATELKEADGYTWAKISDNAYIAIMDGVEYTGDFMSDNDKIKEAIKLLSEVVKNE